MYKNNYLKGCDIRNENVLTDDKFVNRRTAKSQ